MDEFDGVQEMSGRKGHSGKEPSQETRIVINKVKLIASAILLVFALIVELYVIINFSRMIWLVIILGVVMLGLLYLLAMSILDISQINREIDEIKYEEIYRAQKASYLVIRKNFEEMQDRMSMIEENTTLPADEIISAQKAVAKVTISRNKENTDALMNSNDELINHLFSFEEKLDSNNEQLLSKQEQIMNSTKEELLRKNQELEEKVRQLNSAIEGMKNDVSAIERLQHEQRYAQPMMAPIMQPMMQPMMGQPMMQQPMMTQPMAQAASAPVVPEPQIEQPAIMPEIEEISSDSVLEDFSEPDISLDTDLGVEEDPFAEAEVAVEPEPISEPEPVIEEAPAPEPVSEPEMVAEPEPVAEEPAADHLAAFDTSDPNKQLSPDEIAAMFNAVNDAAPAPEPEEPAEIDPNEIPIEDINVDDILGSIEEEGSALDMEPAEEPAADTLAAFDTSDPNKKLSPDEIAAMFNAVNGAAPAPEPEPEPEPAGGGLEEALAGMDTSDPNRAMSPEEIEALFASIK